MQPMSCMLHSAAQPGAQKGAKNQHDCLAMQATRQQCIPSKMHTQNTHQIWPRAHSRVSLPLAHLKRA